MNHGCGRLAIISLLLLLICISGAILTVYGPLDNVESPVIGSILSVLPKELPIELPSSILPSFLTTTPSPKTYSLNSTQKRRAEQLISIFENDTIEPSYDYIKNLDDGRGYTAGRAGFTTADEDFYMVVNEYTKIKPDNPLKEFLPALKELYSKSSDNTSNLDGIKDAWKESAKDPAFRDAQDKVVDELYYQPAMSIAEEYGIGTALGQAFLYDTIIQHGNGSDPDSIKSLIRRTNDKMGGSPKDGKKEKKWLSKMIAVRRDDLLDPSDEDSKDVWSESTDRCDVFEKLLEDGNLDLDGPITVKTKSHRATID